MTRLLRLGEVSGRRPWLDAVPPAEREPVLGEGGGLPQSVEGEDGAAVVGEVDVELRGRVVVRHHRQDRGHDKARRLRPRVRCAHEDVHAWEPLSEPAPTINEAVSAKMSEPASPKIWYSFCQNPESRLCAMFVTPDLCITKGYFCACRASMIGGSGWV